ncbi:MAG: TIGR02281 family clan AA aspartic protease [Pseudomonadota bacterium]
MNRLLARSLPLLLAVLPALAVAADITLFALFKDKAILHVDGARRVLTIGTESPEGVKLVSTDTQAEEAVVELKGKRETLQLGVVVSAFQSAARESVTLFSDASGFFHAQGSINGAAVTFLVDTGANTIAINSATAKRAGIDYTKGRAGTARTASGYTRMYGIKLDTVKVGDIVLRNVEAGVIDGPQPETPLLGMSFLNALEMKRDGNKMELTRRY